MESLSIVAALYNEAENIIKLHEEIKSVCEKNDFDYEIIFVDDGSTDISYQLAQKLFPLRYLRFRKNFGQTAALDAGIKCSRKKYIVTIDGDLQNDAEDIPKLLKYLKDNNLDCVSGWRIKRKDSFSKHFISRGANMLRRFIINDKIHDSGCSLKIYKRECFKDLTLYGEMHRFIPALLKMRGFSIGELQVNHRPRTAGVTKYNWKRTIRGFTDMLAIHFWDKYSVRPLHLIGSIGIIFIFLGIISSLVTVYHFLTGSGMSETAWPLLTAFLLLTGIQVFIFGLFADVIFKNYYETTGNNSYNIESTFNNQPEEIKQKQHSENPVLHHT